MKRIINIILITLLLVYCDNDDNLNLEFTNLKTIEIGDYQFEFPTQFQLIEEQGIDSFIGIVSGSGIELVFDFGPFTSPYQNLMEDRFEVINQSFEPIERQIVIAINPS